LVAGITSFERVGRIPPCFLRQHSPGNQGQWTSDTFQRFVEPAWKLSLKKDLSKVS
jgi:hypothetical protein